MNSSRRIHSCPPSGRALTLPSNASSSATPPTIETDFRYDFQIHAIQTTLEYNSGIDTTPVDVDKKAFLLRRRVPEKEVGLDKIKHKPANSLERINDMIYHTSLESYVGDGKNEPQTNKNSRANLSPLGVKFPGHYSRLSLDEKDGKETIVSPKHHFLPELHKKTHFNAAQALMM